MDSFAGTSNNNINNNHNSSDAISARKAFTIGCFEVAIANFLIGPNVVLNKYLVAKIPVYELLTFRYLFATLLLIPVCMLTKDKFKFFVTEAKFTPKDYFIYFLMAVSGGILFNCIYMTGIHYTTASAAGVISSSIPTLIAIFSVFFLRQRLKKIHLISIALVFLGILILNFGKQSGLTHNSITASGQSSSLSQQVWVGNLIVFLAMIPEAMFTIFAKMLHVKVSPLVSGLYINAINFLLCLPIFYFQVQTFPLAQIEPMSWCFMLLIGFLNGVLFYWFFNRGIAKIDTNTAALLTGIFPISTSLLAVIFLKEILSAPIIIGMVIILTSIYIGVRFRNF